MVGFTNHLWQSTLFAALVAILSIALNANSASTRYWLWFVASLKFLVPFALLATLGSRLDVSPVAPIVPLITVEQINTSFAPVPASLPAPHGTPWWPAALAVVWLVGALSLLARWLWRWRIIYSAVRRATPLPVRAPVPVLSSRTAIEPGVFGLFRPVLLLPEGITTRLTSDEFAAVLAHELSHVRRRDNLTAALHMLVETLFWFHPLVWWIGSKLIAERERACDEAVLSSGSQPHVYAQGILNVCKFYLESPLACVSGVTGSDLKRRVAAIMSNHLSRRLTLTRKLILAGAASAAVAVPFSSASSMRRKAGLNRTP